MAGNKNDKRHHWERDLTQLLRVHNAAALAHGMTVRHTTQEACARALRRVLTLLNAAGFNVGPAGLGQRHIEFLVLYWAADPRAHEIVQKHGRRLAPLTGPLSEDYIQYQLSMLRRLAHWTKKDGLVMPLHRYIKNLRLGERIVGSASRTECLDTVVDQQAAIDKVTRANRLVGLQLEIMLAFRMTRRQAVGFSPTLAEIPPHALPAGTEPGTCVALVRPRRGSDEMTVWYVPLQTAEQRALFARAKEAAPYPGQAIKRPNETVEQAIVRFSNVVLRRCGVSVDALMGEAGRSTNRLSTLRLFRQVRVAVKAGQASSGISVEIVDAIYLEIARRLGNLP